MDLRVCGENLLSLAIRLNVVREADKGSMSSRNFELPEQGPGKIDRNSVEKAYKSSLTERLNSSKLNSPRLVNQMNRKISSGQVNVSDRDNKTLQFTSQKSVIDPELEEISFSFSCPAPSRDLHGCIVGLRRAAGRDHTSYSISIDRSWMVG
ncbi:hypothetical protein RRG08_027757 [Elysia crispata]|uniref:Uncharacterized protein n=1 Tax=Elysia crispata TaxID=231223 RepID=A0AAE0ZAK5_9GAST|nr:hypothetical protein RRG08_027757 [Elysia crispata]